MKNNYLLKEHYIVQLENEQLRERIKKLVADFNELKKKYEERERVVQNKRQNGVTQE
jgi:regulator of replication initiation timing